LGDMGKGLQPEPANDGRDAVARMEAMRGKKSEAERELMRRLDYLVLRMNRRQLWHYNTVYHDEMAEDWRQNWEAKISIAERILEDV